MNEIHDTIAVFGGASGTGNHVLRQALARGYKVRALVRPSKKPYQFPSHENLKIIVGDAITSLEKVMETLETASIIFFSIGAKTTADVNNGGQTSKAFATLKEAVLSMPERQIKRLVMISAFMVGNSKPDGPWVFELARNIFFRGFFEDKEKAEQLLRELGERTGIEWTVIRPTHLVDTPIKQKWVVGERLVRGVFESTRIARADVARFAIEEVIANHQWSMTEVTIFGSRE